MYVTIAAFRLSRGSAPGGKNKSKPDAALRRGQDENARQTLPGDGVMQIFRSPCVRNRKLFSPCAGHGTLGAVAIQEKQFVVQPATEAVIMRGRIVVRYVSGVPA